jgi:hypothetical protein
MSTISSINPGIEPQPLVQDTQVNQPSISIQDLQNLLIIVDLATQRGAFRGPELSQIGALFDKINQFVQAATPPQQDNAEQQPAPQPQQMPMAPSPVMPMTPPFAPKVGG